jgi:hypothetical protein
MSIPKDLGNTDLQAILDKLDQIHRDMIEPPGSATGQGTAAIRTVIVETADTPVQGPNLAVPPGFTANILQRRHIGSPTGYVGFSRVETLNTNERHVMIDADSFEVNIDNFDEVWFNGESIPTGGLFFEIMAER